jgi:hypothetical protein
MAALGAVTPRPSFPPVRATLLPITDYDVVRGRFLGAVTPRDAAIVRPELNTDLSGYVVRQIRVIFRQLWPTHGQRFPQ